jgi:predicted metalloprotease
MLWKGRRTSDNVEDQRGGGMTGIGGGGLKLGGGLTILVIIISLIMGKNPLQLLSAIEGSGIGTQQQQQTSPSNRSAEENELAEFTKVVLADTEDVWAKLFNEKGDTYQQPKLVMFSGSTQSGCGGASASMGPFYCPADEKVYIDLDFYHDMKSKLNAGGDFAMAYVIAHEVGHHVQHLMGISDKVSQARQSLNEVEGNKLSVKLELQADFFAGVWAHHNQKMKNVMESGDLEEAFSAAQAVGDDRLQKQGQGYIVPDAFTHGTSEQRMFWFKKGFQSGDINQGNTFN